MSTALPLPGAPLAAGGGPIGDLRRAILLARTTRVDEAREIVEAVRRAHPGDAPTPLYLWMWIFEGLLTFYDPSRTIDTDRLRRAHAVALATGRTELAELAAAWAAHLSASSLEYADAARWLLASKLDHALLPDARTRACLAAAEICQDARRRKDAAAWFERARVIASENSDFPSIIVSISNRAVLRLSQLWSDVMLGHEPDEDLDSIQNDYRSALSVARFTQDEEVFASEGVVIRSRIHVLKGELPEALALLSSLGTLSDDKTRNLPLMPTVMPMRAWIHAQLDQCEEAAHLGKMALAQGMFERLYPDEARVAATLLLKADERCHLGLPRKLLRDRIEIATQELAVRQQRALQAVQTAGLALH